ncbi:MAG TPA: hypothetical protein VJR87_12840 [Allosphingosinicella sp.]|nr:hypothetical protein [Allosphingosinicella sp.]HKT16279.1 hypothetical protein [Allosphingosinicella sp.]
MRSLAPIIGVIILALAAVPAGGQGLKQIDPTVSYVHGATGMSFPPSVGRLERNTVVEYDAAATDVSAGYKIDGPKGRVIFTVYIFPAPPAKAAGDLRTGRMEACGEAFEGVKNDIKIHPGARLIEEGEVDSPSPKFNGKGKRVVFSLDGLLGVQAKGPFRSEAELFCYVGGRWQIMYRTTAPVDVTYEADLADLMRGIAWPVLTDDESRHEGVPANLTLASAPRP